MLYKDLGWEEYLAKFALHWLWVFEDSLKKFCLAQLLLKLLIPCLDLGNSLTQIFIDLNDLFLIFPTHAASLIDCLH